MQIAGLILSGCEPINYNSGSLSLNRQQAEALRSACFFGGILEAGQWSILDQKWQTGDVFNHQFPKTVVWLGANAYWYRNRPLWDQFLLVARRMGDGLKEFEAIWSYFLTLWPALEKHSVLSDLSDQEMCDADLLRCLIMRPKVILFEKGSISRRLEQLVAADLSEFGVQLVKIEVFGNVA